MNKTTEVLLIIFFILVLVTLAVWLFVSQSSPLKKSQTTGTGVITQTATVISACGKQGSTSEMGLTEAKTIANSSSCVADGKLTTQAICNDITGTWWIDLDIQKEGCNPACVINVETKQAEINWRCTGLK